MRFLVALLTLVVAMSGFQGVSFARGLGKPVTKATQKALGLDFELSAIREPEAVIVSMTIPRSGKLIDVRQVRMSILAENQRNYLVLVPLAIREADGKLHVSAQLAPELAAKASLELVVEEGRRETYYDVRVAGYITERNDNARKLGFEIRSADGNVVISSDAILSYEWATHTLTLKDGLRDRLRKDFFGAGKPLTIPFVACLASKPVYEGQFVSPAASQSSAKVSVVLDLDPHHPDRVRIQRGYAIDETRLVGHDVRANDRIRNWLVAAGKLR